MEIHGIFAIAGLLLLLGAFTLNSLGKINRKGYLYNLMNLFGGGFLAWHSIEIKSIPFTLLQSVWTLIAAYGLIKHIFRKNYFRGGTNPANMGIKDE